MCIQCHSNLGDGCFTILFDGAYFLLAVMVVGDKSSRLKMVLWKARADQAVQGQ